MPISRLAFALVALLGVSTISYSSAFSAPLPEAAEYEIDSGHSIVIFKIRHLGVANFYGTFDEVSGEVTHDAKKPGNCAVKVQVNSSSIDSNSNDRDVLLKSADFFDSENHPSWSFESTSVKKGKGDTMKLMGKLTLRGVEKEIEAELETVGSGDTFMGTRAGWEARFTINRNDFKISGVPGGLGEEVEVIVAIEGMKRTE